MASFLDNILSFIKPKQQQQIMSPIPQSAPKATSSYGPPTNFYTNPSSYPITSSYVDAYRKMSGNPNAYNGKGDVMGASTGPTSSFSSNDQGMIDRAKGSYGSALDAINARLNMMRDIARRNIDTARSVRDEIVGNIGNTYNNLRTFAGQKRDTALENLNQEDIGVQNTYGKAAGDARRAFESAILQNRMRARAQNRLDSSFYDNAQADTTNQAASTISNIGTEEAGKRSAIGTRKTETKNWFEQEVTNLAGEEAQLKSQADREYQDKVNAAADMERSFGIDSTEAAAQAADEYQSRLDTIEEYIRGKDARLAQISGAGSNARSTIDSFDAISPTLRSVLENARAITSAKNMNLPVLPSVSTGQANPLAFMNTGGLSAFDQLQRLLGNAVA